MTGDELKRELDRLGETQTELADTLGVSRGYVSKLIKGAKPFSAGLQEQCRRILSAWDVDRSTGGESTGLLAMLTDLLTSLLTLVTGPLGGRFGASDI